MGRVVPGGSSVTTSKRISVSAVTVMSVYHTQSVALGYDVCKCPARQ
jgi:hypothetical protein